MFITFEGGEGSGKTTVMQHLVIHLKRNGIDALATREPGGCGLGEQLRAILLDSRSKNLAPEAELFMFLADRAQHVADTIRPALACGQTVFCDRYTDSTIAYQGYGRGKDIPHLQLLNKMATAGLMPDLTILLDIPVKEGLARAAARNSAKGITGSEGRFDSEAIEFHERVRAGFLALAHQNPQRIVVVNASHYLEQVQESCLQIIQAFRQH